MRTKIFIPRENDIFFGWFYNAVENANKVMVNYTVYNGDEVVEHKAGYISNDEVESLVYDIEEMSDNFVEFKVLEIDIENESSASGYMYNDECDWAMKFEFDFNA